MIPGPDESPVPTAAPGPAVTGRTLHQRRRDWLRCISLLLGALQGVPEVAVVLGGRSEHPGMSLDCCRIRTGNELKLQTFLLTSQSSQHCLQLFFILKKERKTLFCFTIRQKSL